MATPATPSAALGHSPRAGDEVDSPVPPWHGRRSLTARPPRLSVLGFGALVLVAATLAGLALGERRTDRPTPGPAPALVAQTRVDALAGVAKRLYFQEVFGTPDYAAFRVITALPAVIRGLETGQPAIARRELDTIPVRHAVHERVTRGRRTVLDVGLKFVVAGQRRPFYAPDGRYLGRIEISVQDVIGFVKLVHRLAGVDVLVRGNQGHVKTSRPALVHVALPDSGPVAVGGQRYYVSSFSRVGFAGEPLKIWVLNPD